jgi:hypothetical protein
MTLLAPAAKLRQRLGIERRLRFDEAAEVERVQRLRFLSRG